MAQEVVETPGVPASAPSRDEMLIRMWLHGRPANTAAAYRADVDAFLAAAGCGLDQVTLAHLQDWDEAMGVRGLKDATRARRLTAVRTLFAFAHKLGYLTTNPAVLLSINKPASSPAERIIVEADVTRMIAGERNARCRALLRLLYVCGLRASEACGLCWRDLVATKKGAGEAHVLGKGGKQRTVVIPATLWTELAALTPAIAPGAPVVPGRDGGALNRKAVHRIVKRAAKRVGLDPAISPHFMRHSHASHSLDNGCAPHVLQKSMGHASLATTTKYLHVRQGEGSASFIKS